MTSLFLTLIFSIQTYAAEPSAHSESKAKKVYFQNGSRKLGGLLYKPSGVGPFPTLLYNHGSAPGSLNDQAADLIAPKFLEKGWAFFMPYRRGQGLSSAAGPYVSDEISKARESGGVAAASTMLVTLLKGDHLEDQLSALRFLKTQEFVDQKRIAVAGNSFGGIETVLAAAKENFCAAVDASGGAESWSESKELQDTMKEAVKDAQCPIFFFQAANDFDLSPSKVLSAEMTKAAKKSETKIYPSFGETASSGHAFAYRGVETWFPDVFAFLNRECAKTKR